MQASLGEHQKALDSYDGALRLKPDFGPAHAARAESLYALGRNEEAQRAVSNARAAGVQVVPQPAGKPSLRMHR